MRKSIILVIAATVAAFLTLLLIVRDGRTVPLVVADAAAPGLLSPRPDAVFDMTAYNSGRLGNNPNRTFRSSSVVAPEFGVNIWDASRLTDQSLPFLFLTASEDGSETPFILNSTDLSLIWGDPKTDRGTVMNFRPQNYLGEQYLTWWEGSKRSGRGNGDCVLYDHSYEEKYRVTTKDLGVGADLHECKLTNDGTALLTAYNLVPFNLSLVGGKESDRLLECYFQEVDVETGELLFSWAASDWFSPMDSFEGYRPEYDFFHLNSIEKDRNGNYLISSRHTNIVALIAGNGTETPGEPLWIMNGKRNQFLDVSEGPSRALDFSWQHHARFLNSEGTEITLFDNHHTSNSPGKTGYKSSFSKGMVIRLSTEDMTVSLVAEYVHPLRVQSGSMGSFQALEAEGVADGNFVAGWGSNPGVSEFTRDGKCVMDIQFGAFYPGYKFGSTVSSYRSFKGNWLGLPATDPDISTNRTAEEVYVSWNGATEVRSWAVYVDDRDPSENITVRHWETFPKEGFETKMHVPYHNWIEVKGLDVNNKVLGSTGLWNYKMGMKSVKASE